MRGGEAELRRRLRELLDRRRYVVNETVEDALDEFVEMVERQRRSGLPAPEDDDLVTKGSAAAVGDGDDVEDVVDDSGGDVAATTIAHTCPCCGERIPIAIDLSGDDQDVVQDCTVCCRPLHIAYSVHDGRLGTITVEPS